jgi:hypothetical protein
LPSRRIDAHKIQEVLHRAAEHDAAISRSFRQKAELAPRASADQRAPRPRSREK